MRAAWFLLLWIPALAGAQDKPKFDIGTAARSIGYLDFESEGKSYFCNVGLIGRDLGVTNQHCIGTSETCTTATATFYGPDGETVSGRYPCAELLFAKANEEAGGDYAFIRFSRSENGFFPGELHGVIPLAKWDARTTDGDIPLWRIKIDPPTILSTRAKVSFVRCRGRVVHEAEGHAGDWWQVMHYSSEEPCHLMSGNSGGLLLNASGQFLGLTAWARQDKDEGIHELNLHDIPQFYGPTLGDMLNSFKDLRKYLAPPRDGRR